MTPLPVPVRIHRLFAGAMLGSFLLSASALAVETSAPATHSQEVYGSMLTQMDNALSQLDKELSAEIKERVRNDILTRQDMEERIAKTQERILDFENRLPPLDEKVEGLRISMTEELDKIKTHLAATRAEMELQVSIIKTSIKMIRGTMSEENIRLSQNIELATARIDELELQMIRINNRLDRMDDFIAELRRLTLQLQACVANGSCVNPPRYSVQLQDISIPGSWSFLGGWARKNTGLSASEWQYCSVTGNENMGGRDFSIYISGGTWWLETENDNAWGGDMVGTLKGRCMKII